MPKELRSSSLNNHRASPYPPCYKNANKTRPKSPSPPIGTETEWEETRCPICIDHPHNAVLLLCSSREKGCRPYMCDTSSRHSNCLDQFRKTTTNLYNQGGPQPHTKLVCPLCRGQITGWIVVDPARHFMNKKPRSCSSGTCDFIGNYTELRKHARRDHPCVRPTEVDPDRELEWRIMRENMENQDMFSMQFEFDDNAIERVLDDLNEIASPLWDIDLDFMNFLTNFDNEFTDTFPEIEGQMLLDEWDSLFGVSSIYEMDSRSRGSSNGQNWSRESSNGQNWSRESGNGQNWSRESGNGQNWSRQSESTTRRRSNRNGRQRATWSNQSSDSRQGQVHMTRWVDFPDIEPNLP